MSSNEKTSIVSSDGIGPGVQLNGMYEIDRRLASGGMGEVYRGHNIQTGDPVAIKIVLPEFARDESILALFRKEASILNHLSHDAIVRYHVFSIDPALGRPYLAMEYVDGQSLADRMAERALSPREARKLLSRIASGLALAHEAGVIHRDLSPDNIILPGGNVNKSKIIDFGIARSSHAGGATLLGGKFAGKYNFVSPEQLGLFGGDVTERSDIYSLALVIAGALRGEALDMSGSQVDVIEKRRVLPDLIGIDETLRPLLEAMLQPDPANRPEHADDIVEWLRATAERSIPPLGGTHPSLPPASYPPYFGGGHPDHAPPGYGVSQVPQNLPPLSPSLTPRSMPPLPPGGMPPQATSTGIASMPPAGTHAPSGSPAAAGGGRSRSTGIAIAAVVLLALGAGAAYVAGVFPGGSGSQEARRAPTMTTTPSAALEPEPESAPMPSPSMAAPAPAAAAPSGPVPAGEAADAGAEPAPSLAPAVATEEPEVASPEERAAWVRAYDGGACVLAEPSAGGGVDGPFSVFATADDAVDSFAAAYREAHGDVPDTLLREVTEAQCPAVDLVRGLAGAASPPTLELSTPAVRFGEELSGRIDNYANRPDVLLVADDGRVYDLGPRYENGVLSFKLGNPDPSAASAPRPQLIVVLTSPAVMRSSKLAAPADAATLFPAIAEEMAAAGPGAGATVAHFLLGG